jgi:DNA-binding NarL/FixJ family response regulator
VEDNSVHGRDSSSHGRDNSSHGAIVRQITSKQLDAKGKGAKNVKSILKKDAENRKPEDTDERRGEVYGGVMNRQKAEKMLRQRKTVRFHVQSKWRDKLQLPLIRSQSDPMVRKWHMFFVIPLAYE